MPVPFEALIPYGIMGVMVVVSGAGIGAVKLQQNGGKRHRYAITRWDDEMMRRDRRLTGYNRGQTDRVEAPPGFELNNPWTVEYLTK